jgi:hypothetical protein
MEGNRSRGTRRGVVFFALPALAAFTASTMAGPPPTPPPPVQVIVDMDANTPGFQSSVRVSPCAAGVEGIAVWVIDPLGSRTMYSIGYVGGIDRGIAFGHMPTNTSGSIAAMSATTDTPVHPANTPWALPDGFIQKAFNGPEVQYIEGGSSAPAAISAQPAGPIFNVSVTLQRQEIGDVFHFYLFDMVTAWHGSGGAFSTQAPINSLDTGGDVVPDGTFTSMGIDADPPAPVPPASFYVNYIDGLPGPSVGEGARIVIAPDPGDVNADCSVNVDDLLAVIASWGPCPAPPTACPADIAPVGAPNGVVNVDDLLTVIMNWS